uniref:SFRICE_030771 n=1 Tax=Spodoptera frugiperda TaxID=7108 RepID=A0A2H1WIX5_SPOFR
MHGIISELVQRPDESRQLEARVDCLQAEVSQLQKKLAEATAPTPQTSAETGSSSYSDLEDIIRKVNLESLSPHSRDQKDDVQYYKPFYSDVKRSCNPTKTRYPPHIVEKLLNWVEHFTVLKWRIGHAPNARPFGKEVRFTPRSDEEYRAIQAYLADSEKSQGVAWFSYSLPAERSVKVAIRGLPVDTTPETILEALQDADFGAEYVRPIRVRQGRPGCLYYAQVARAENTILGIYGVKELRCVPGIKIEAWRGKKGPVQCHRCQQFRHSSHNCLPSTRTAEAHTWRATRRAPCSALKHATRGRAP